ncbi:MAG: 50S ribosomal protein L4, partial [Melioribacteraceae bacterium]
NYSMAINKKVNKLARKSALSYKAKAEQIIVVEDFNFDSPKTKNFVSILKSLKLDGKKTLLLTADNLVNVYKSGRNVDRINILEAINASTYDLLNNQILLVQKGAIEKIEKILN